MNGMPSENVDELDSRVKKLEGGYKDLQHCFNELFAETRDLLKVHANATKPKKRGVPSGK